MRRALLFVLLVLPTLSRAEEAPTDAAIRKAANYLWSQQTDDGSWPSKTYGVLKTGQALTPFVLVALLDVPQEIAPAPKEKLEKALAYIRKNVNADGAMGMADPLIAEYPNYATALAVVTLAKTKPADDSDDAKLLDKMVAYLKSQQLNADGDKGWSTMDSAFGAWGYGGVPLKKPEAGHADLSVTRYVLQALQAWKPKDHKAAFDDAWVFLERVQNYAAVSVKPGDGGFFFSTVLPDANKAGKEGDKFKSYGTATADGMLAMMACDPTLPDELARPQSGVKAWPISVTRLWAAQEWLLDHHLDGGISGMSPKKENAADKNIRFYYTAAAAQAFRPLTISKAQDWRKPIREFLLKAQREDGSFANDNLVVKEDDPLIATPFALLGLIHSR